MTLNVKFESKRKRCSLRGALYFVAVISLVFCHTLHATNPKPPKDRTVLRKCVTILKQYSDTEIKKMGPLLLGTALSRSLVPTNTEKSGDNTVKLVVQITGSLSPRHGEASALSLSDLWEVEQVFVGLVSAMIVNVPIKNLPAFLAHDSVLAAEIEQANVNLNLFSTADENLLRELLHSDSKVVLDLRVIGSAREFEESERLAAAY
ncbi:MAG TPA: hypothetical protein PLH57_08355, partial [Oligoflexia bacterium]|nr:hypothetical protein [Oligoflexia bacterium]